jgi:hypothetical protein
MEPLLLPMQLFKNNTFEPDINDCSYLEAAFFQFLPLYSYKPVLI